MGVTDRAIKGRLGMRVQDFGHLDGPVVLFGGPYSNLQALEAMAEAAAGRDAICTGDIVGYCADPNATTALFRDKGLRAIAGNCERQLAEGDDDCGCGFDAGSTCSLLSRGWWPWLTANATPDTVRWLGDLPDIGCLVHRGRRYGVIHGGVTEIGRFLWPSSSEADFAHEIAALEAAIGRVDGVISGHCGIAFQRMIGRHHWINAGAIGLPPHDGRPETRFGVLMDGEVTFERLSYDHGAARARMEAEGLTQGYHLALTTGIWPSEDVLPDALRR